MKRKFINSTISYTLNMITSTKIHNKNTQAMTAIRQKPTKAAKAKAKAVKAEKVLQSLEKAAPFAVANGTRRIGALQILQTEKEHQKEKVE